jgi:Mg2+/citrate symporter
MTRVAAISLVVIVVITAATIALARLRGKSDSRASVLLSVVAYWLAAYAIWTVAGAISLHFGLLRSYDATYFGLLALALGAWQYRTRVRTGPEPALAVFVGGQLAWLLIIGAQNGLFTPP